MDSLRKTALVAGVIYLVTFVSIPTLSLYGPVRNDPNYILGPGPDTPVLIGAILEVIVACVGTAVVLYPVVKRQHEGIAMGFIGSRVLEAATIFAGVVSLLSVVTLRQAGAERTRWPPARRWSPSTTGPSFSHKASFRWSTPAAGLPAVSLPPGASDHSARGADRSAAASRFRYRRAVRPLATSVGADGDRRTPDRAVGVLAGRLVGRQRLQALAHHRWNGPRRHPARLAQRRDRLTKNTSGMCGCANARRRSRPVGR
jgi:Domain of unknown function (DUF4386)